MKMPKQGSNRSKKKETRGVSTSTPDLNGRIQKRQKRRLHEQCCQTNGSGPWQLLEVGQRLMAEKGHERRGGGSMQI